jgi:hypothetical protein
MKREHFVKVVEETLDSLPREFRSRNVAVLVEDLPLNQPSPPHRKRLLLGSLSRRAHDQEEHI